MSGITPLIHAARVARGVLIVAREQVFILQAAVASRRGRFPNSPPSSHPPVSHQELPSNDEATPGPSAPARHTATYVVGDHLSTADPITTSRSDVNVVSNVAPSVAGNSSPVSVTAENLKPHAFLDTDPGVPEPELPDFGAPQYVVRERAVPESPLARVAGFGALAGGLLAGAAAEAGRRALGMGGASDGTYSAFVTDANAERLASSLSRMRGAALKLGQMLSIQDERVIPPPILKALERVRQGADVMPHSQLNRVLEQSYGDAKWRELIGVVEFDETPIAAASIGQVHRGKIRDGDSIVDVVFKVQYPGVARSISSDLNNLKRLVSVGNMIPDNFYIDEAIAAAREELARECDYINEARCQEKYRELVLNSELSTDFYVPKVYPHASTKAVLVSEFIKGVPVDKVTGGSEKNRIASLLLQLTLTELFEFGVCQSDPNFSNFFYDKDSGKMNLIDFGATQEYDTEFLLEYIRLIEACAKRDERSVLEQSRILGFLTGEEPKIMRDAHVKASFLVGEPFHESNLGGYNFAKSDIPARTAEVGKVMLKYRLTPPPKEAYSLHRRLSGTFLTSTRMGATVDAAKMLRETLQRIEAKQQYSDEEYLSANGSPR